LPREWQRATCRGEPTIIFERNHPIKTFLSAACPELVEGERISHFYGAGNASQTNIWRRRHPSKAAAKLLHSK